VAPKPVVSPSHLAFGETIKTARLRAGYRTKEAFAVRAGLSTAYYNSVERGRVNVTLETLFKIADALGSSVAALCWDLPVIENEQRDKESVMLGKSIRETREARAMTPAELAAAASIEREDLEALEAGRHAPDDLLSALGAVLGMDLDPTRTDVLLPAFAARLRELREERGLSQEELSRLAGDLGRNTIFKLESGDTDPRLTTIQRLARGLRVPLRALIEMDDPYE
jgi:transcriptional regulator with XRE-family HTH domain